ncbi:ROK family transcriptional regulator [Photobacterium halotolerans]|uniref:ROK family transcriptional regulator n=1 Tax=Photobacterium halotolerans TaxID=265726 RepID=A0A0F5VAF0_9GAMM|nr:ROK family transcriptional regulator [Photobacterium halotolerans]KKC98751.1 hypothetical protein KY46_16630 [Photobacterium halotolerans]
MIRKAPNIKQVNTSRVIDVLWRCQNISRIDIADRLGLDKSTITKIVSSLAEKQLITEVSNRNGTPQSGRPKVSLQLNKQLGVLVGIELTDSQINLSVLDLACQILYRKIVSYHPGTQPLEQLGDVLAPVLREVENRWGKVLAIGLGMPGLVRPDTGVVSVSSAFEISEPVALAAQLSAQLGYPVYCDNDANCAAWGQVMLSRPQGSDNLLYVLFTSHHRHDDSRHLGIGLGFVLNGQLFYGDDCLSGQFDVEPGPHQSPVSEADILAQFVDKLATLGRLLNVHQIVFGGEVEPYVRDIERLIHANLAAFQGHQTWQPVTEISTLGTQAVSAGAAALAWSKITSADLVLFDVLDDQTISQ